MVCTGGAGHGGGTAVLYYRAGIHFGDRVPAVRGRGSLRQDPAGRGVSGGIDHHHHRIYHGGFQPVAADLPQRTGDSDVHRRLRRQHRRRHQGVPHQHPVQDHVQGAAQLRNAQERAQGGTGRQAPEPRGGARGECVPGKLSAGVHPVGAADQPGRRGYGDQLHRRGRHLQQHRPRPGTGGAHRKLRAFQPLYQGGAVF